MVRSIDITVNEATVNFCASGSWMKNGNFAFSNGQHGIETGRTEQKVCAGTFFTRFEPKSSMRSDRKRRRQREENREDNGEDKREENRGDKREDEHPHARCNIAKPCFGCGQQCGR